MTMRSPTYALIAIFAVTLCVSLFRAPVMHGADVPEGMGWAEAASTMFDRADYALARSWRAVEAGDGEAARHWARESLDHASGNAYASLALAWGGALSGDDVAARTALAESYRLAPKSQPLAVSRVALAQRWWPEMNDEDRLSLLEEVRIARGLDAHRFNQIAEETPRLRVLHDIADGEFGAGDAMTRQ